MPTNPTPPPWGPHGMIHFGEIDGRDSFKLVPLPDYVAACRAVNRAAAGEALAEAGREALAILEWVESTQNIEGGSTEGNKLRQALAAYEAARKEGADGDQS